MPVYKLLGGETKERIPAYCTGNDIEQHLEFGFKRLKLAIPHGPADGREGMKKNVELVKRTRDMLGPDGDIMLDCWMSWTERYTLEMAEMVAPYRVYWMEECLQPHDYEGFGRLNAADQVHAHRHRRARVHALRFPPAAGASLGAAIWQPDIHWCGGLTELRRIAALAAAYDIPVIPHARRHVRLRAFHHGDAECPWAELFMPAARRSERGLPAFEEDNQITRGPEGIYMRPSDRPGFGWDIEVT